MDKKFINFFLDSGDSVTAEYQAILDRATALGYTAPSAAQQVKQNTLVSALKAAGIWDLLDVFYIFATDGDANFATLNWKAPTLYKITQVNTPTFTADEGFNSNGTTQYLNTGWNPNTNGVNYVLNSASLITYFFNHVTENKYDLGVAPNFIGSPPFSWLRGDDGFGSFIHSINQAGNAVAGNGANCVGLWHSQRKDASNNYLFKNGVQVDTDADASTAVPSDNIFLLALNNGGGPSFYSTKKMSCFGAGASLNGLEAATYTAWNTYLTSL